MQEAAKDVCLAAKAHNYIQAVLVSSQAEVDSEHKNSQTDISQHTLQSFWRHRKHWQHASLGVICSSVLSKERIKVVHKSTT